MIVRSKMVIADDEEVLSRSSAPLAAPLIVPPAVAPSRTIKLEAHADLRVPFVMDPAGLAVEQYKMLRGRLNALEPRGGVLLVTSPAPGDGKTLTSINLAWSLAQGGFSTCLVDLDFRAPGVTRTLELSMDDGGVEEVLTGKKSLSQALFQIGDRPFHVLGIRERVEEPSHLYATALLQPLLSVLRTSYRWVILDLSPAVPMSDVSDVLPQADGALMVVRSGKSQKSFLPPLLEILGRKLWGVVLNDTPVLGSAYYGSYGKHYR
jgi:capsular exopolysaccharide synthesis family protein